jgi:hypothetical protein
MRQKNEEGKVVQSGIGFKIRLRARQGYVREAQGYIGWTEYQVVAGRKVEARFDTLEQAQHEYPGAELDTSIIHALEIAAKPTKRAAR